MNQQPQLALVEASLSLLGRPLIDTRAPIEFAQGGMPNAINLPLMDDVERRDIGICYKEQGQSAAIELGHKLVSGEHREAVIDAWAKQIQQAPDTILYCARGGMRSKISQTWLAERGINIPRIRGGWKAMRQCMIRALEAQSYGPLLIIAGLTGCAKTTMVNQLSCGIDLEGHARHKGSAFGQHPLEGPSQIDFEHGLTLDLLNRPNARIVEDESQRIGRLAIPATFWQVMREAPLVRIEMPLEWRLEQIRRDYIEDLSNTYLNTYGPKLGQALFQKQLMSALKRLGKRLGNARLSELLSAQTHAFRADNLEAHDAWLAPLLRDYYDTTYHHQVVNKPRNTIFVGDWQSCFEFALDWQNRHS